MVAFRTAYPDSAGLQGHRRHPEQSLVSPGAAEPNVAVDANVQQRRPAARAEAREEPRVDFARSADPDRRHADALGPADEVDPRRLPRRLAAEELPVSVEDHVVAGVVEDGEHDGEAFADGDERLHPHHLHASVAADADDRARAIAEREPDGAGD